MKKKLGGDNGRITSAEHVLARITVFLESNAHHLVGNFTLNRRTLHKSALENNGGDGGLEERKKKTHRSRRGQRKKRGSGRPRKRTEKRKCAISFSLVSLGFQDGVATAAAAAAAATCLPALRARNLVWGNCDATIT